MNRLRVTFRNGQRTIIETDLTAHEMFEQISAMEWAASEDDETSFRCDDVILIETAPQIGDTAPNVVTFTNSSYVMAGRDS